MRSPSAYSELRNFFYLPTVRTLRNHTSFFGNSLNTEVSNSIYLKKQFEKLVSHEKTISLKFDEVQIRPYIDFDIKNKGFASNKEAKLVTNILAFMITFLLRNYKEI